MRMERPGGATSCARHRKSAATEGLWHIPDMARRRPPTLGGCRRPSALSSAMRAADRRCPRSSAGSAPRRATNRTAKCKPGRRARSRCRPDGPEREASRAHGDAALSAQWCGGCRVARSWARRRRWGHGGPRLGRRRDRRAALPAPEGRSRRRWPSAAMEMGSTRTLPRTRVCIGASRGQGLLAGTWAPRPPVAAGMKHRRYAQERNRSKA